MSNPFSKFFSINSIMQKSTLLAKRFPISALFIVCFAGLFSALFNDFLKEKDISYKWLIFFPFGSVICLAAALCLEDFVDCAKQYATTAAAALLWGAYCFFLPVNEDISTSKMTELSAIGLATFLSVFFISFLKKDKDKAFWNFTTQTVFQLCLAAFFGTAIFTGLMIAVFAIENLFNITMDMLNIYGNVAIACYALFSPFYFLANIPSGEAKHNEEIYLIKHWKIFALYILTPLAAIYALILYAYLFKIIFTWELPSGNVSYLVSTLACCGLLIITLLYPARLEEKNKFIIFMSRYFGLLALPLLALMTIGIFRRINDYGVTILRFYVLLANIWFYGIFIYLFITKALRIKWIFVSFTAIVLAVSIGFWSIPNITKNILTIELNKHLDNQKISSSNKILFEKMEQKDRDKIREKLIYLHSIYGKESVLSFFDDEMKSRIGARTERYNFRKTLSELIPEDNIPKDKTQEYENFYMPSNQYRKKDVIDIEHFNTFVPLEYPIREPISKDIKVDYSIEKNELIIKIVPDDKLFTIPLMEMVNYKEWKKGFQGDDYVIFADYFDGKYYEAKDSIYLSSFGGYLFYNR